MVEAKMKNLASRQLLQRYYMNKDPFAGKLAA